MKKNWFAIYTKPNCEKKVAASLSKKKIENYYPVNQVLVDSQSNKKKVTLVPLMSSYVFVHISDKDMEDVKSVNSVINFIYWLDSPAIIPNEEILNIQQFTAEYYNVKLEKTDVRPFEVGKIISEPHIDLSGKVMSLKNTNIKLTIPSLGYKIVAEVETIYNDLFNQEFVRSKQIM